MLGLSVLIVDDEPLARDGLRILLEEEKGIDRVSDAKHGEEAIRMIREESPDLVFLDVQMPEVDGFDVVREVGPERMPGVIFDPSSKGAQAYIAFGGEMVERIKSM